MYAAIDTNHAVEFDVCNFSDPFSRATIAAGVEEEEDENVTQGYLSVGSAVTKKKKKKNNLSGDVAIFGPEEAKRYYPGDSVDSDWLNAKVDALAKETAEKRAAVRLN